MKNTGSWNDKEIGTTLLLGLAVLVGIAGIAMYFDNMVVFFSLLSLACFGFFLGFRNDWFRMEKQ